MRLSTPCKRPRGTAAPPPKRRRVARVAPKFVSGPLPDLPEDVWCHIAAQLPPRELAALAQASTAHLSAATPALHAALWRALHPGTGRPPQNVGVQLRALTRTVSILDGTPSLRHKRLKEQLVQLATQQGESGVRADTGACFTAEQARAFLGVDAQLLCSRFTPAATRPARSRKPAPAPPLAFAAFPPDPMRGMAVVFELRAVLSAAWETHGDMRAVRRVAEAAAREDVARVGRAELAEREVQRLGRAAGVPVREVEYVLGASADVVEFRRGTWSKSFERYAKAVAEMFEVHVGLEGCYRCLLICDGNARLKAKRIVGKILRSRREYKTGEVIRALEGNLWWARSKTNVQKMEEMSRNMPHIRV